MSSNGWIKLHRKLLDNPLWREKREFSKAECWIDILLNVQHSDDVQEVIIKNQILHCHRGESLRSIETWAARWGMSKSKARRVLILFQNCSMIVLKDVRVSTRLTVLQFSDYNDLRNADETQMKRKRNADETQMNPDKNVKNERMKEYIKKDIVHPTDICPPESVDEEPCRDLVELSKDPGQLPRASKKQLEIAQERAFEVFWQSYPKKQAKKTAFKAWQKIKPSPTMDDAVKLAQIVQEHAKTPQWKKDRGEFIPMASTWLNNRRWEDDLSAIQVDEYEYSGNW